jgi:hypothetical protein
MIDMKNFSKRARVDGEYLVTGFNSTEKRIKRNIYPTYSLGYTLGCYLSVGTVNLQTYKNSTRGIVFWYFEKSTSSVFINKFLKSLEESFNLTAFVRKQERSSTFQVVCYSKPLAEFFSEFGKKSGRKKLPNGYLYKDNSSFVSGLLTSLEDFKGNVPDMRDVMKKRHVNVSIIELYKQLKSIDSR